ncbi:MAG: helix-hairpin-helix domain-containing protein [Oscillospiraceae bacterium]|nr:helix-hairpin-helix domain-containing protein [Oscillospiraceae bacterium]
MKSSEKDLNRIILAAVLLVASAAALITGGLMLEKRDAAVPAVEIIEAEPERSEISSADTEAASESDAAEPIVVNINTAGAEELMKLKGVGEKTAQKIIEYRRETPFETIEDIMNVSGIGEKKFEDMRDMICV